MLWWTEANEEHIARHGVDPGEVTDVVIDPRSRWFRATNQPLFHVFGRSDAGRYLFVVLVPSTVETEAWFVVTARDMTSRERARYQRK